MTEVELIQQEISETVASLAGNVEALGEKAREAVSLSHHIAENPWLAMGLALGAGIVASSQAETVKKIMQPLALECLTLLVDELAKQRQALPVGN